MVGKIYGQVAVSLRKGDPLAISRAQALTADNLKQYYDLLKTTLETHGLMNLPSRIYNMDESGMPLDHKLLHLRE